ncbi:MAG: DUF4214 domain-containing protein [Cellulomonas sp.]|nr:DUF4214 domain-containing protein [Cellulomonas sp.]
MSHPTVTSIVLALGLVVPGLVATSPGTSVAAESTPSTGVDLTVAQMDLVVPDGPTVAPSSAPTVAAPTPEPTQSVAPTDEGTLVATAVAGSDRVVTAAVTADDVQSVGVTWPQDADGAALEPQLRTLTDGTWSDWQAVPASDDAPDPGTADAATSRGGTDAVYVGDVDAVQMSFAATQAPADTKVALVGSSTEATGASASGAVYRTSTATTSATAMVTAATVPTVISRAQWGAAGPACTPDVAATLVGAVVHHTAGSNSYTTQAQAMQMIRNDQAYHINTRGWCDIGYNFIVDKWGNIYEGRANSLTQAVIGVHAGGFNTGTVGVSMLGTYDDVPSNATIDAVGRLIGYRLAAYGRDPMGTMQYTTGNGENSRYKNTTVTLPRIMGHRDVAYTACPGNGGYAALPAIRAVAAANAWQLSYEDAVPVVRAIYVDMMGRGADATGLSYWSTVAVMNGAGAVANAFARTPEYVRTQVVTGYRSILGREASEADIQYWSGMITSGALPPESLRGYLAQSDEYWLKAGGTPDAFVATLYSDVLGRAPSAADLAFWTSELASKGRGYVAVKGIWRSPESGGHQVDAVYDMFLDRTPDAGGRAFWASFWSLHGDDALRSGIVGSAEYLSRAHRLHDTA